MGQGELFACKLGPNSCTVLLVRDGHADLSAGRLSAFELL